MSSESKVSSKPVWVLAFSPIMFGIALYISTKFDFDFAIMSCLLLFLLFAVFVMNDVSEMKIWGIRGSWKLLALIVLPVYLFIRAAKTDGKYIYAIVGCLVLAAVAVALGMLGVYSWLGTAMAA